MKARTKTILSTGYWFSALSLGLLVHPYITLRKMIRDRLLRPLVLLPFVSALGLWVATMVLVRVGGLLLRLLGLGLPALFLGVLGFGFWWLVLFLALWQLMLIYLFVRFYIVFR